MPDRTADMAAAFRAAHYRDERPLIVADPFAHRLTSPGWRAVCRYGFLRHFVLDQLYAKYRPIRGQLLYRARIVEDWLEQFVDAGGRQYVLLGAGLDSFALRRTDLAAQVRVFEIDRADAQKAKRERIRALGPEPENLEWIALDEARETVHDALRRSTFRFHRPAFFSWPRFSGVLDQVPLATMLDTIAVLAEPGSLVAVEYAIAADQGHADDDRVARDFTGSAAGANQTVPTDEAFARQAEAAGFQLLETVGPAEQASYFAARTDGLRAMAASRVALLALRAAR